MDPSKFAHGIKCLRLERDESTVTEDGLIVSKRYKKSYHPDQVLIETPKHFLVSPTRVTGLSHKVYDAADATWSAPSAFGLAASRAVPSAHSRMFDAFALTPVDQPALDSVLTVLMEMGRPDAAFEVVARHLQLPRQVPTSWVIFERFAHRSPMILMTSETTAIRPEGILRDVIEYIFILSGGWHGKLMYRDPAAYDDVMVSIRNPWKLSGVTPGDIVVDKRLHSVYRKPAHIRPSGSCWSHEGVLYLPDGDGALLPYWYTDAVGTEVEQPSWAESFRRQTASHLGLSILLARRMERFIATSESEPLPSE